jgi:hypothetical protein
MEAMDRMREEMLEVKQELKNHKIVYQELLETRRVLEDEKQKVHLAKVRIQNLLAELEDRDRSRVDFTSTPRRAPIGDSDSISQVCVSRERKVLVFKGIDSEDVVEWVDEVRRCIRSKSTAEQLACILEHLQGDAKREILYRPVSVKHDPEKVLDVLVEVFQGTDSLSDLQESFYMRRQQNDESLLEYSIVLMQLWDKVERIAGIKYERVNIDKSFYRWCV